MKKRLFLVCLIVLGLGSIAALWNIPLRISTSIQQDTASVTPYAEVVKSYTNVKGIEIYNAAKNLRVGFNDTTTTDSYWVIPSTATTLYAKHSIYLEALTVRLKGDTSSDTATVRLIIWK